MLQRRSNCTDRTIVDVILLFQKHLKVKHMPLSFKATDKALKKKAGVSFLRLHGCPECNKHVYKPDDTEKNCPYKKVDGSVCGHPRYDENNQPHEVFFMLFVLIYVACVCVSSQTVCSFILLVFPRRRCFISLLLRASRSCCVANNTVVCVNMK